MVDMAGTDRADATAFAEFRKALQHFLVPQIYDRASVEGVVRNIGKEQRPTLEFLISLMEQDQDEDLAGLAQASRGASIHERRGPHGVGPTPGPRHLQGIQKCHAESGRGRPDKTECPIEHDDERTAAVILVASR